MSIVHITAVSHADAALAFFPEKVKMDIFVPLVKVCVSLRLLQKWGYFCPEDISSWTFLSIKQKFVLFFGSFEKRGFFCLEGITSCFFLAFGQRRVIQVFYTWLWTSPHMHYLYWSTATPCSCQSGVFVCNQLPRSASEPYAIYTYCTASHLVWPQWPVPRTLLFNRDYR